MTRPHVKDHPPALRAFRNQIECGNGPRNAAMAAVAAGGWPAPDWVRENYCPMHAAIAALEASGDQRAAITFRTDHIPEHQQEVDAIRFCELKRSWAESTSLADDDRTVAEKREVDRQKERAAFVSVRAVSLFEQWLESKRAEFRAEAAAEFDALHEPIAFVATAPEPEPMPLPTPISKNKITGRKANSDPGPTAA